MEAVRIGRFPVYSLVAASQRYDPDGLLCWMPKLNAYASVDPEHGDIITFPNVTWRMISANPVDYLDVQWRASDAGERVLPWLHFAFHLDDNDVVIEPYPEHCPVHDGPIARQTRTRHRLFRVLRRAEFDDWLETSRKDFPHSGVPISESELLCCQGCFEAESRWVSECEASIPPLDAWKNSRGFVKCPRCGTRFMPRDSAVFADAIHLICGQKINVLEADTT